MTPISTSFFATRKKTFSFENAGGFHPAKTSGGRFLGQSLCRVCFAGQPQLGPRKRFELVWIEGIICRDCRPEADNETLRWRGWKDECCWVYECAGRDCGWDRLGRDGGDWAVVADRLWWEDCRLVDRGDCDLCIEGRNWVVMVLSICCRLKGRGDARKGLAFWSRWWVKIKKQKNSRWSCFVPNQKELRGWYYSWSIERKREDIDMRWRFFLNLDGKMLHSWFCFQKSKIEQLFAFSRSTDLPEPPNFAITVQWLN